LLVVYGHQVGTWAKRKEKKEGDASP